MAKIKFDVWKTGRLDKLSNTARAQLKNAIGESNSIKLKQLVKNGKTLGNQILSPIYQAKEKISWYNAKRNIMELPDYPLYGIQTRPEIKLKIDTKRIDANEIFETAEKNALRTIHKPLPPLPKEAELSTPSQTRNSATLPLEPHIAARVQHRSDRPPPSGIGPSALKGHEVGRQPANARAMLSLHEIPPRISSLNAVGGMRRAALRSAKIPSPPVSSPPVIPERVSSRDAPTRYRHQPERPVGATASSAALGQDPRRSLGTDRSQTTSLNPTDSSRLSIDATTVAKLQPGVSIISRGEHHKFDDGITNGPDHVDHPGMAASFEHVQNDPQRTYSRSSVTSESQTPAENRGLKPRSREGRGSR